MTRSITIATYFMLCAAANALAQAPTLGQYFQKLADGTASVFSHEQLLAVADQIAGMSQEDIKGALPSIFSALKDNGDAGIHAAFALTVIAERRDSSDLLRNRISDIAALLKRSDSRLKVVTPLVFLRMSPPPTNVAVPILSSFILKGNAALSDKVASVAALITMAPSAPETEQSAVFLLGSAMDVPTKAGLLNAIGTTQMKNEKIIDAVAKSVNDPNDDISLSATQSLTRMGPFAIMRAQGVLSQLALNSDRSEAVRRLAQNALNNTSDKCRTLYGYFSVTCPTP